MVIRSMRLTKLNNDGTPISEPVEVPCRIDDWSIALDCDTLNERMTIRPIRFEMHCDLTTGMIMRSTDESSPDTSQPYPLDALIGRIDELTT